ncbi:MAG: peptide deformylase [Candidatus Omnitrophota bacterium]
MKMLEIKKYPDKILRIKSKPVKEITGKEVTLLEQMLLAMRYFSGVGLAAPQVGVHQRIIVADIGEGAVQLANPEILEVKGTDQLEEGCLSVPCAHVKIERPYRVVLRGLNEKGKPVEIEAKGLLARVLLHEIDHLDGKLIVDYMSFLGKIRFGLTSNLRSR